MTFLVWAVAAYLLGAIPFGYFIGRARGIDIRQHGSGNIGATNVGRVLGRRWGFVCLALDILKGFGPTFAAGLALVRPPLDSVAWLQWLAVGLAAVLGHLFPVYLGFRGGKGVATTIGVAAGIYPYFTVPIAAALAAYGVVRYATGVVSAGSLALAVVFPVAVYAYWRYAGLKLADAWPLLAVSVLLGLLIIVRHRENILRLLHGQELGVRTDAKPQ